jgi:hypothetical protein
MRIGSYVKVQTQDLKSISGQVLTPRDWSQDLRALTDSSVTGLYRWLYYKGRAQGVKIGFFSPLTYDIDLSDTTAPRKILWVLLNAGDRTRLEIYAVDGGGSERLIDRLRLETAGTVHCTVLNPSPRIRFKVPDTGIYCELCYWVSE